MKKGYTLAEILITVGIIGVVVAMILPELRMINIFDVLIFFVIIGMIFGQPIINSFSRSYCDNSPVCCNGFAM